MVHEYYVQRLLQIRQERQQALAVVRTRSAAQKFVVDTRRKIRRCFGPFPLRTPLNPRITGSIEHDSYRIDKLIFESRPGYLVTANLFVPYVPGPRPVVLSLCGHSENGKALEVYQACCHSLAAMGCLVLTIDPVSQGERYQYRHMKLPSVRCTPCEEHNLAGNQQSLIGEFFGTWRAWDAIRGLDYLLARPEADSRRVGVTGNSGGGTMTTWLAALDDRITMLAPSCFVVTFLTNLENELPADSEQYPPFILKAGLDMADFLIAAAPKPVLLMGQRFDFFDIRGLKDAYADVRRIYRLLGEEKDAELSIGPDCHGYTLANRQAMYRFFGRHAGLTGQRTDRVANVVSATKLYATAGGAVADVPGNRFIYDFTAEAALRIADRRKKVTGRKLAQTLVKVLALPLRKAVCHHRILRPRFGAYCQPYQSVYTYAIPTEPQYPAMQAFLYRWDKHEVLKDHTANLPIEPEREILLYVPHISSRQDATAQQVPVDHETLWSVDVRGMGMSQSMTCNDPHFFTVDEGGDYMYAAHGQMLGEPYVGRRVHDLLCTLDVLQAAGAARVHLAGRGLGAILAAFAAVLHPVVKQVTLKNAPPSFLALATAKVNLWPLSILPWDVLHNLDLTDCYQALAAKKLRMIEPWNGQMQPQGPEEGVCQ